jgi:hypothetical protein
MLRSRRTEHGVHGVGLVVDGEARPVSQAFGVSPQDAYAGSVEGGHPHALGHRPDQGGHPLLHLVGRLVGEGYCQNLEGRHAGLDQMGHSVGEDPGLARAGPGDDEQRPGVVDHRLPLDGVQASEKVVHVPSQDRGGL